MVYEPGCTLKPPGTLQNTTDARAPPPRDSDVIGLGCNVTGQGFGNFKSAPGDSSVQTSSGNRVLRAWASASRLPRGTPDHPLPCSVTLGTLFNLLFLTRMDYKMHTMACNTCVRASL